MSSDLIKLVVTRVLNREFRSRTELANALGVHNSYVARLSRKAVEYGLVDRQAWASSFRTGRKGQRGKNKNPRRPRLGPTAQRVLQILTAD